MRNQIRGRAVRRVSASAGKFRHGYGRKPVGLRAADAEGRTVQRSLTDLSESLQAGELRGSRATSSTAPTHGRALSTREGRIHVRTSEAVPDGENCGPRPESSPRSRVFRRRPMPGTRTADLSVEAVLTRESHPARVQTLERARGRPDSSARGFGMSLEGAGRPRTSSSGAPRSRSSRRRLHRAVGWHPAHACSPP